MKRQKLNNKGFSLVELIVVIAIMGVVSVGGIVSYGLLYSANAKEASAKLNSALNKTRIEAMSKVSASIEIYENDADSKYYATIKVGENEQDPIYIGSSRVVISYEDTNTTTTIEDDDTLVISFDRETGAFKPIRNDGTVDVYCKEITVEAGHKTYTIQCEKLTGKTIVK